MSVYRVTAATADGRGRIYTVRSTSAAHVSRFLRHWHAVKVERIPSRNGETLQ